MVVRLLIFLLEKVVGFLPWRVVLAAGTLLGAGAYVFQVRRRRRALENLTMALGDTRSPAELRRLTRGVFLNIGRNLTEIVWVAAKSTKVVASSFTKPPLVVIFSSTSTVEPVAEKLSRAVFPPITPCR